MRTGTLADISVYNPDRTEWLAFAHLILALLLVGPLREPMRNRWVIGFGIMAYKKGPQNQEFGQIVAKRSHLQAML